jgi:hypothetical protein
MACEMNKCAYADFPKRLSNLQTMMESSGINKQDAMTYIGNGLIVPQVPGII